MKKSKVGLITFCAGNQGSALQCYATQKYLSKKGLNCCLFIRRENGIARIQQSLEYRLGAYLKLMKFPQYRATYRKCRQQQSGSNALTKESANAINRFIDEYISVESCSWRQLQQLAQSDEYMAFFSGSDQIWSGEWFLTNRIWFLRFCPEHKRVAWAPSFGSDTIAEYNKDIYRHYITEYQFLSVREASGQSIIHELTGKEVSILPDPVYLISADEWRMIATDVICESKYILMFFISKPNSFALEFAHKMMNQYNAKIIWLSYNHGLEGMFVDGGPCEFVSYIDKATIVLTDSFHASLFSIILSTPFYVYQRTDNDGSMQIGRIQNLLEKFNMQDRLMMESSDIQNNACNTDSIHEILNAEKNKIDVFLKKIIDFYLGGAK